MHIYRSGFADVAIPDTSITELVFAGLEGRENAAVLTCGVTGRTLSGGEFRRQVERLAGGLAAKGFGRGQVAAIFAPNHPDFAVAFHGVAWAGGTVTTLNPTYTADEVRHQLRDSGARLLFTVPALVDTARAGAAGTEVEAIAVFGEAGEDATSIADLMGAPLAAQAPVDPARDMAVLPYSSGTTGLPKGVMLTHRNLVANVLQVGQVLGIRPGDVSLAFLPYFHIYGMTVLMNLYLARGGGQVTLPRFDLEAALRLIQEHRIRQLYLAPPVVLALAKHPLVDQFDLSSLDFVLSGAAPLGAELGEACAARLGCETAQGYGMTEMSPVSHITPPGKGRPGSVGLLTSNTESRLVDPETGEDCAPGATGELWVRGPQVMAGYLHNPEATAATLSEAGWLRTGDLARIDADGYTYLVDRVKELIKVSGFQVAPAELEARLIAHPGVADVAVVGVPDAVAGEVPKAFVVAATATPPELAELQAFLEGHVAHYKQVRHLALVETIPKSPSGKILRRFLRASHDA
jgi:acyl-CoA synthetase (AMP-forming)/AMP-acid ligase II